MQEDLIRCTYRVMARVGTQRFSLRAAAEEAGVTAPLFTYHFGTKHELMVATLRWALIGTVHRIRERLNAVADPEEAFRRLVDAVFVGAQANRDFHLVYFDVVQYCAREGTFGEIAAMLTEHIDGSYRDVIQLGVDRGVFTVSDVDRAARHTRAFVEGSFLRWLQDDDWQASHVDLKRECEEFLLAYLTRC